MDKVHQVELKGVDGTLLKLIVDGKFHQVDLSKESEKLKNATAVEREKMIVSPAGYGIHWPLLDEDLSIDALLGIQNKAPSWKVAEEDAPYTTKEER